MTAEESARSKRKIERMLDRLDEDIAAGKNVRPLPDKLINALRAALDFAGDVDLDSEILGDVDLDVDMIDKSGAESLSLFNVDTGISFGHPNDERAFFEWLDRIPCVAGYAGKGSLGLVVRLKSTPSDDELQEIIALCRRFGVDMCQLAKFETAENRAWLRDPGKYWHQAVFSAAPPFKRA